MWIDGQKQGVSELRALFLGVFLRKGGPTGTKPRDFEVENSPLTPKTPLF
jgi:hypothetical protein